jgi:hypothetical protein
MSSSNGVNKDASGVKVCENESNFQTGSKSPMQQPQNLRAKLFNEQNSINVLSASIA